MEKIGRFEIVGKLGRGAFGMVYKGRDPVINRMAAIKVMSEATVGDPELVARFKREAEAAGGLNHRNIVTIYDLGEHNGLPYIAMEYLEGKDLEKLLKEKLEVSVENKIEIMIQVGEGLEYAHNKGIIHRDIKPANVRLLDDLTVKIMDFGIAKMSSSDMTRTGQFMGTVNYMSPEQIKAKKIDGRSDLFAVGVMFYEMLSYRRPFPGDSITAVIYKIVNENPPPLKELHGSPFEWLEGVVFKCLEKDPTKRWENCKEFAEALRSQMRVSVDVAPSAIDSTLILAQKTANEGDIEAALSQLDLILEQDPDNPTVLRKRRDFEALRIIRQAESLASSGRLEQARDELLKAKEAFGEGDELLGRTLASVEDRMRGARADSMYEAASRNLTDKRYEAAIELLQQALQIDPYNERVKSTLARASEEKRAADVAELIADAQDRHARGQLAEAKAQLQKALDLDPQSRHAKAQLATVERDLQHSKTRSAVEEAVFQAKLSLKKESYDAAIRQAEEALSLDSKNQDARAVLDEAKQGKLGADERKQLLQLVEQGSGLLKEKKFSEARVVFQRALKLDANLQEARLGVAAADKRRTSIEAVRRPPLGLIAVAVVVIVALVGFLLTRSSQAAKAVGAGKLAVQEGRLDDAMREYLVAATAKGSDAEHGRAKAAFGELADAFKQKGELGQVKAVLDQVQLWQGLDAGLADRYLELAGGLRDRGVETGRADLISASAASYATYFKEGYDKSKQVHYETIKEVLAFGDTVVGLASDSNRDIASRLDLFKSAQDLYTFVDDKEPTLGADQKRAGARADRTELSTVVDGVNTFNGEADRLLKEAQGLEKDAATYAQAIDRYRGVSSLVAKNQHLASFVGLARFQEIADGGIRVLNQRLADAAANATAGDLLAQAAALESTGNLDAARRQYQQVLDADANNANAQAKVRELDGKLARAQVLKDEVKSAIAAGRIDDAKAKLGEALQLLPTDSVLGGYQAEIDRQLQRASADEALAGAFREAEAMLASGDLEAAQTRYEKIRDGSNDRSVIDRASQGIQGIRNQQVEAQIRPFIEQANQLIGQGKHADAMKPLREAERLNANYPGLRKTIGDVERVVNRAEIERRERELKAAFDNRGTDASAYERTKRELLKVDSANRLVVQYEAELKKIADAARTVAEAADTAKQAAEERKGRIQRAVASLDQNDPEQAAQLLSGLTAGDDLRAVLERQSRLKKARDEGQAALQQARAAFEQKKKDQAQEFAKRAKEVWPPFATQADAIIADAGQIRDEGAELKTLAQAGRWSDAAEAAARAVSGGSAIDGKLAGRVFFNASFYSACKSNPCDLAAAGKWAAFAAKYDDAATGVKVPNARWAITVPKFTSCEDLNLQTLCKQISFK